MSEVQHPDQSSAGIPPGSWPEAYECNPSAYCFRALINTVCCRARRMGAPEGLRYRLTPQVIQQPEASGARVRESCVT